MTILVLEFKKIKNDSKPLYNTFYLNPKAETTINGGDIDDVFESIYSTIISNIPKSLGKVSACIIGSVIGHNNDIEKLLVVHIPITKRIKPSKKWFHWYSKYW